MSFLTSTNERLCVGDTYTLGNNSCSDAVRVEWELLAGPAAAQAVFSNASAPFTDVLFTSPGRYTIRRCCFTDEGGEPGEIFANPVAITNCPSAVIEGDSFILTATGCTGVAEWTSFGAVDVQPISATQANVIATGSGSAAVTFMCEQLDPVSGGTLSVTDTCAFMVYPDEQEFDLVTTFGVQVDAVFCGESCTCETEEFIVELCGQDALLTFKAGVTFKACPDASDKPPQADIVAIGLTGTSPLPPVTCNEIVEKPCEDDLCFGPNVPVIHWNDVLNCGWTMTASGAVNGTSIASAAACNVGKKFCFDGTVTINFSGPAAFVDSLVIYGLSGGQATITTSPLTQFGGQPFQHNVYFDAACGDGFTIPVIVPFADVPESVTDVSVTIQSDGITCIDHIFLGQKLFIEPMDENWINPFNGSGRDVVIRQGDCGPVSISSQRRMVPLSLRVECEDNRGFKDTYAPLIRYLECGNPLMFQWSINNYPQDFFYGWINPIDGASYQDCIYPMLNLTASGFIQQLQSKDLP